MVSPALDALQLAPLVVVLKMPCELPRYTVAGAVGSTANAHGVVIGRPVFTVVQLAPPFVVRKAPAVVPA